MKAWTRIAIVGTVTTLVAAAMVASSGLLDAEGPQIDATGLPTAPTAGPVRFRLSLSDGAPGLGGWTAELDGAAARLTLDGDQATLDLSEVPDGPHVLRIAAWDRAWTANFTRIEVPIEVDRTPPRVEVATASLEGTQGRLLAVHIRSDEPLVEPQIELLDEELVLYPVGSGGRQWRALVGVAIRAPVGPAPLLVHAADGAGNAQTAAATVEVRNQRFPKGGTIRLRPDQVAARKDEEAKARMRQERDEAYAWPHPEALWDGAMLRPVTRGSISSPFGRYRTYSDGQRSHHTGTDIAAPTGTPVLSAAAGEVRFAGEQAIFGKVVIVHHGQGLATSYNHLSQVDVEVGQRVGQGDPVGAVGSTGQSTGPHLHWGVTVHGVAVDGMPLLKDDLMPDGEAGWSPTRADDGVAPG